MSPVLVKVRGSLTTTLDYCVTQNYSKFPVTSNNEIQANGHRLKTPRPTPEISV